MYDPRERALIAEAIAQRLAASEKFTFVDIGANVGLYALFVAACAGGRARVLTSRSPESSTGSASTSSPTRRTASRLSPLSCPTTTASSN